MTVRGIVIIIHSFDVLVLKKVLNRTVLQTANLSKVVKRRRRRRGREKKEISRGRRKGMERERGGGWRAEMDEEISEKATRLVRRWREKRVEIGK